MKRLLIISLLPYLLFSCSSPQKEEDQKEETIEALPTKSAPISQISVDVPEYQFEFSSLRLNENMANLDLKPFKHYGEFYTDDFTIYRLDRIDYLAESYYIEDINLYFIDSLLVKIQAFLREDKSSDFISKYGKAKITINNYHNKKLIETENILQRVNGRLGINDALDYYKLKWEREALDIEYAVNKQAKVTTSKATRLLDGKNHRYKLTFQTKDFNNQMAWVKWEAYKEGRGLTVESED